MPREQGLALTFEYNTDLFDRSTIERMRGHLETLLRAAVRNQGARIGALPLLTGQEEQGLQRFEPGPARDSMGTSFIEAFERQAARTPRALALLHREQALSYEEARCARQPARAPPGPEGRRSRCPRRRVPRALDRRGGGVPGDPQGGRCLRPVGPDPSE
ncbi:hypothetical protein ACN28I_38360 [Archangium gephyra]|uniref:hypothetical protein n=1 Tax=Archangium gephyra TaxID=48 RepID=UPI003B7E70BD